MFRSLLIEQPQRRRRGSYVFTVVLKHAELIHRSPVSTLYPPSELIYRFVANSELAIWLARSISRAAFSRLLPARLNLLT